MGCASCHCVVPENIHIPPTEGNSVGWGGSEAKISEVVGAQV